MLPSIEMFIRFFDLVSRDSTLGHLQKTMKYIDHNITPDCIYCLGVMMMMPFICSYRVWGELREEKRSVGKKLSRQNQDATSATTSRKESRKSRNMVEMSLMVEKTARTKNLVPETTTS